jgi:hypothetical protein
MIDRPINEAEIETLLELLKRATGLTITIPPGFTTQGHWVDLIASAVLPTQRQPPGKRPQGSRLPPSEEKVLALLIERATGVKIPPLQPSQNWASVLASTVGDAHGQRMTEYLSKHKHPV